jgi:hypothetical protein
LEKESMTELRNSAPKENLVRPEQNQYDSSANGGLNLLTPFYTQDGVPAKPPLSDQQLADKLQAELSNTRDTFEKDVAKQGLIGETFDWMKGHLGASASNDAGLVKRGWSNILNYDNSSIAIRGNLANTEYKLQPFSDDPSAENLAKSLKDEIQVGADGQTSLKIRSAADTYDRSQREGVNEIASAAVVGLSLARAGKAASFVKEAIIGAGAKTTLKAVDGAYSTPIDDALTGGVLGLSGYATRLGGKASDNLVQRLEEDGFSHRYGAINALVTSPRGLSAFRSGMEFAPVGALTAASSSYTDSRFDGNGRFGAIAAGIEATPRGAVEGFAVGALFGALRFRTPEVPESAPPPSPVDPKPPSGGGGSDKSSLGAPGPKVSNGPKPPDASLASLSGAEKHTQFKFPFIKNPSPDIPPAAPIESPASTLASQATKPGSFGKMPPPESPLVEPERIFVREEPLKVHPIFKRVGEMTETEQLQVAKEKQVSAQLLSDLSQTGITEVKVAVARNSNVSTLTLEKLAGDLYPSVRLAVAESTKATEQILSTLAKDSSTGVRTAVARNHTSDLPTLEKLATDKHHGVSQAALKTLYDGGDLPLPSQIRNAFK